MSLAATATMILMLVLLAGFWILQTGLAAGVEYLTKDQALQRFRDRQAQLGHEDLTKVLDSNPLPASLQVRLKDPKVYGGVVEFLKAQDYAVAKVDPVESYVDRLLTITTLLR